MIRYVLGGLLVGLILEYAAFYMQTSRPGTLLPQALFFGPWLGGYALLERALRRWGYWVYLTPPLLYALYGMLIRLSERRARLALTVLLVFVFHYSGVVFSAQMVNMWRGEPNRFLLMMKAHGIVMALSFAVFITANVLAIMKGWIAKE